MNLIKLLKLILLGIMLAIAVLIIVGNLTSKSAARGIVNETLDICPTTPNCISSVAQENSSSYFPPAQITPEAWLQFKSHLASIRSARIVEQTDNYIHVVFTTSFFRFKDDAEFFYNAESNLMNLRSASRLGKSDLGKNRKRMNALLQSIKT